MVVGFIDKLAGITHFDCFLVSKRVCEDRIWSEALAEATCGCWIQ